MITTCTVCQAQYRLEADKVPPRVLRVRCPDCGGVFILDGTAPAPAAAPAVEGLQTGFAAPESAPAAAGPEMAPPAVPESTYEAEPVAAPDVASSAPEQRTSAAAHVAAPDAAAATVGATSGAVATAEADAEPAGARRRRSKEEMLARALVSDILVYNREQRDTALAEGNLLEALGGEIKKSWELYKEKVTPEVANSTNHFRDALNDILAEGDKIF
jgi:predicted Zn finger-like uncharacterized protein